MRLGGEQARSIPQRKDAKEGKRGGQKFERGTLLVLRFAVRRKKVYWEGGTRSLRLQAETLKESL